MAGNQVVRISRTDVARGRGHTEFMSDVKAATMLDAKPWAGLTLVLLIVLLAVAWLWAESAVLDEVTVGTGRVIPSSREQIIQSLEGGILAELAVREGDVVSKDQVLLRLDDTRFGASYRESHSRITALRAAIARLRAESVGATPVFPADVRPEQARIEMDLFRSRRQQLDESVAALKRSYQLADEELQMTAPLVKKGLVSEVELLRLQRQVNELKANLQERQNKFRSDARADLAKNEAELAATAEGNTARADQVKRTVIRSPMRGTVKNIRITTVGGIVQPGQDILEIVPLEDQLVIEARIKPADVAFLRPGLPATVKITAYDYAIYGGLEATLEQISADTLRDEKKPDETYYKIQVRTREPHLKDRDGKVLPIIPGMTATVDVLTGHKTVLDYLLKPLLKARQTALRER
jgi:adhesin transport system membrane fusion protein